MNLRLGRPSETSSHFWVYRGNQAWGEGQGGGKGSEPAAGEWLNGEVASQKLSLKH